MWGECGVSAVNVCVCVWGGGISVCGVCLWVCSVVVCGVSVQSLRK